LIAKLQTKLSRNSVKRMAVNMEAIVTATKKSSELICIDKQYGTLEVGKFANFIVLNENPLDNNQTYNCGRFI